jgi:O-antigen biosynthesis protein
MKLYLDDLKLPRPGMRILHFAPEFGLSRYFQSIPDIHYEPVDFNPGSYNFCQARKIDLCTDAEQLETGRYDLIVHSHVLEHVKCNVSAVFYHLHRALNEGGYHLFSVPIIPGYTEEFLGPLSDAEAIVRFGQADHVRNFGALDFENNLALLFKANNYGFYSKPDEFSLYNQFTAEDLDRFNIPEYNRAGLTPSSIFVVGKHDFKLGLEAKVESSLSATLSKIQVLPVARQSVIQRQVPQGLEQSVPLISILMPTYNYGRYIGEAIDSVFKQDFDDFELIISDNCSTDNTEEIIQPYLTDKRVIYSRNPTNVGMMHNLIKIVSLAAGKYCAVLCSDDIFLPGHLSRLAYEVLKRPDIDVVYSNVLYANDCSTIMSINEHIGLKEYNYIGLRDEFASILAYGLHIKAQSSLVKSQLYKDYVSVMNNSMAEGFTAFDADMFLQFAKNNTLFAYVNFAAAIHRKHSEQATGHATYHRGQHLIDNLLLWDKYVNEEMAPRLAGYESQFLRFIEFNLALLNKHPVEAAKLLPDLQPRIDIIKNRLINFAKANSTRSLSKRPLVTVVMPTKNRPHLLQYALKSLLTQNYAHWQAIVINDGGVDVEPLVAAIDGGQRKIHYIFLPTSKGHAYARNVGLEMAQGEVITYLDDDNVYLPNHLEVVVDALTHFDEPVVFTQGEWVAEKVENGVRSDLHKDHAYATAEHSLDQLLIKNYIDLNVLGHRKSCLLKVKGFDESLTALVDWDLVLGFAHYFPIRRVTNVTAQIRSRQNVADNVSRKERKNFFDLFYRIYQKYPVTNPAIQQQRDLLLNHFQNEMQVQQPSKVPATIVVKNNKTIPIQGNEYLKWRDNKKLTEAGAQLLAERMMKNWKIKPVVTIIIELSKGEEQRLADTIDSLSQQLYSDWRLVILAPFAAPNNSFDEIDIVSWLIVENAENRELILQHFLNEDERNWFWLIPAGTQFEPQSLMLLGDYINLYPQARLIYADDDEIEENGILNNPRFKPEFNLDYLYSYNYLGSCAVSSQALIAIGGWNKHCLATDYDLALRLLDHYGEIAIAHIPEVLLHIPKLAQNAEQEHSVKQALENHIQRKNINAEVQQGYLPATFSLVFHWQLKPLVSIIVPTRDRLDILKPCIDSLIAKTSYPNYEVIVVDNQSELPETQAYFQELRERYADKLRILSYPKVYNYSAINNFAAEQANGEYLLLLNNDTVIVHENWLERMLNHGQRTEVGIVGARLVFPDQTLQHAGVILGMGSFGVADHPHISLPMNEPGYMNRAQVAQNFSAVTAACLLIRKSIYQDVGGLDDQKFKVLFNDVDLCLKVREQGYKIVWTPYVTLIHHGSSSIKAEINPDKAKRAREEADNMLEKWLPQLANDPAYNRNLSLKHRHFQIEKETDVTWNADYHDRLRVYAFPANETGIGEYRVRAPLRALTKAVMIESSLLPNHSDKLIPDIVEIERVKPDVFLLQNGTSDYLIHAWEQYRRFNSVFRVYSQDDLVYALPGKHPLQGKWPKDMRRRLRKLLEQSDRLIVANEPLREAYSRWIADIRIVPNYLERARWLDLSTTKKPRSGNKLRIGWAGGAQHHGDLEFIIPVVEATKDQVDWIFMGMCPDRLKTIIKEYHGGVVFDLYPQALANLDLDLAIAPLEYNNFNMAKTNLRILEYGVMGWPVICSDIEPYRNAPVTRVGNNTQYWLKTIREKIVEPDALRSEGKILQQWVMENYLLEDHLEDWLLALSPSS